MSIAVRFGSAARSGSGAFDPSAAIRFGPVVSGTGRSAAWAGVRMSG
ncbi:hypothetical protein ACFWBN_37420 [Streptomyces sp. NPDC059989]